MWLYLCMKLTKITTDLYYFYLLSDINSSTEPNERAFMSADNAPMSSTVCQYTGSPKIRTLRKQGSNDVLPNDASLCEPWNSACDVDDRCDPNPCQNNGTCVDLTDSFNCTCDPGWEDVNCTTGKADYSFFEILAISLIA
ncbi:sushi, nidogen and EGF-like domain-containing protein 1 [Mytilus edulis]|uniref:sushi, nidogen and EGF-like domain-containing protein 1 n=1 Tax=Mytilus edulis TaxID=6550 RepID=UPI0039F09C97